MIQHRLLAAAAAFLWIPATATTQQHHALFDAPVVASPADAPPFQRLLDHDGDGDADVVGHRLRSDAGQYHVRVWTNEGGSLLTTFDAKVPSTALNYQRRPLSIEVGDFDGDGHDDFVIAGGTAMHRYASDGNGGFSQTTRALPGPMVALACGDFDGDGKDDVAWTGKDANFTDSVFVDLTASGVVTTTVPALSWSISDLLVVDLDGLPGPDLVVTSGHDAHLQHVGPGGITAAGSLQASTSMRSSLWAHGDVDGDGDADLVAWHNERWSSNDPFQYDLFRRTGSTTWTMEPLRDGGPAEFLHDIDGDGDLDGVCCGGGGGSTTPTWPSFTLPSKFEIALGDGTGGFVQGFSFPGLGSAQLAGCADMDGDGDEDMVAGRVVYYAPAPLTATPMPMTFANLGLLRRPLLDDGDRDGDPDLWLTPGGGSRNLGDGTFERIWLPGPADPPGKRLTGPLWSGDFDGDGAMDVVYTQVIPQTGAPPVFDRMVLVRNDGGGHWYVDGPAAAAGVEFGMGDYTLDAAAAADVDGDGDLDVISRTTSPAHRTALYLNDGQGWFVPGPTLQGERIEEVDDLDGDGIPDAVVSTYSVFGQVLGIRPGTGGTGLFGPSLNALGGVAITAGEHHMALVDADDDGRRDVLFADALGVPQYWHNTSTPGSLAFQRVLATTLDPMIPGEGSISALDVDGDGRTDLAFGPFDDDPNVTRLLLRLPGSTGVPSFTHYAPPVDQVVPPRAFPADADGDGDTDLLGSHTARNNLLQAPGDGARRQYGQGTPGVGGHVPVLGASGPFRVGGTATLRITGAAPGVAVLGIAGAPAELPDVPLPGITAWIDPDAGLITRTVLLTGRGTAPTDGAAFLPVSLPPALRGVTVHLQAFVLDSQAPTRFSTTGGLALTLGG